MPVAASFGDVDRPLPARVHKCAKREHVDELLNELNGGAAARSLMQGSIQRRITGSGGIDKIIVLEEQFKHAHPVVALGGIRECGTDLKCFGR